MKGESKMDGKENTKGLGKEEELEDEEDQNDNSGAADTGADDKGSDDKGGKDTGKKKERSFSQEQVNKMMTREKNQGRAAAYKELGIDPKDTKMVKMFQAFIESQKTDEQKAAEKDIEAQNKQAEMEQRALTAEAKAEAMMLGVKPQYVEDAVTLALSKMSDDTDMKTVLSELKEKYSLWFEEDEDDDSGKGGKDKKSGKTGQKGTGASVKEAGKKGGKDTGGFGARLAAQRKPTGKSSYWGGNR